MREFSKVSPSVWRSKKFRSLKSIEAKLVYQYLLSCPHGNSAGCFDLHLGYATADMDIEPIQYQNAIKELSEAGLIEVDEAESTVLIVNWFTFNFPANWKHAIGIISQLLQASSETLKRKAFQDLLQFIKSKKFDKEAAVRNAIEHFLKLYPYGIATETRPETESETETRPDLDKTETREVSRTALRPAPLGRSLGPLKGSEVIEPTPPHHLLETDLMRRTA